MHADHLSPGRCLFLAHEGPGLGPGPWVFVDVCGSCHYWGLCRSLWLSCHLVPLWCARTALPWGLANLDCLHRHPGPAAEIHVWVPCMPWVCIDIPGLCCCQGPRACPGPWLRPVTMMVSEGCATAGIRPVWAARAVNWGHGIAQTGATGKGHVWVWGFAVASVCVDVCDSS